MIASDCRARRGATSRGGVAGRSRGRDANGGRPATTLADAAGLPVAPGNDPWALEQETRKLEERYRNGGVSFVRGAGTAAALVGSQTALVTTGLGALYSAPAPAPAAAAVAVVAGVLVRPIYAGGSADVNRQHRNTVLAEFTRRRLPLPLTIAPGETRAGSAFYPMVRSPRSLERHWTSGSDGGTTPLPLAFLTGLHVPAAAPGTAPKSGPAT